ncbi:MAG: ABC transporter ATP-binding protein [Actinobacteria bacterium]|nr:ABC transporter ATP-binding protein [Actinomycetota bacterium]
MTAAAIEVTSVTKEFRIYQEQAKSAKERIINFGRNPHHTFKALDDVTFEIAEGETFALLGHNGSGKSTLLKCVAGTLRPTSGKIVSRGRLAALLELGAGFHPDLTGRENIYLNGSILGFSRTQIDAIFDDIVEFAELWDFIDNQVKHYSSGMYARLGFAVAINVEPEILLVDEVLSVGDESFQRKCIDRVRQLQTEGRTILLVSHAAELVRQLADRAAVLDHGRLVDVAEPGEAIRTLRETLARRGIALEPEPEPGAADAGEAEPQWSGPPSASVPAIELDKPVTITSVAAEYPDPDARFLLPNQPMRLRIDYVAPERVVDVAFAFEVVDQRGELIYGTSTQDLMQPIHWVDGVGAVCFDLPRVPLLDGSYLISVSATSRTGGVVYDDRFQLDTFEVMQPGIERGAVALEPTVVHFFHGEIPGQEPAEPVPPGGDPAPATATPAEVDANGR